MNDDLITLMANLSEPPPPASLKATVMARIAREADERQSASPAAAPARSVRDRLIWIAAFAGLAVVAGAVVPGWLESGALTSSMAPRLGLVRISLIPDGLSTVVVGLGLLVYLAGLFGPLRSPAPGR